jgi:hypothetical protein
MTRGSLPEGVLQLDELEILVVVDNETDTLSSVDEGVPQIPEVARQAAWTPPSRTYEGHECRVVFDQMCCACHGFSLLVRRLPFPRGHGRSRESPRLPVPGLCTVALRQRLRMSFEPPSSRLIRWSTSYSPAA